MSADDTAEFGTHLDDFWTDGALRAIEALAATGRTFSASQLRDDPYNLPDPAHPSHWGAVFSRARTEGLIEPAGYAPSSTSSRKGGVQRVWRAPRGRLEAAA